MNAHKMIRPKKKTKPGKWILLIIILLIGIYLFTKDITLDAKIGINSGEGPSKIFAKLGTLEKARMKLYLFTHKDVDFSKLEAGEYAFSGSYTRSEFVKKILQGPEKDYTRVTILEGRSIYDIDAALARK